MPDPTLSGHIAALGARTEVPGGGAATAITGAQAASLISMVANFSDLPANRATDAAARFLKLAEEDAAGFKQLMTAYRLPKSDPGRGAEIERGLDAAAGPPAAMAQLALDLEAELEVIVKKGNPNLITDTAMAALLLETTLLSANLNIGINLQSIKDETKAMFLNQLMNTAASTAIRYRAIADKLRAQVY